MRRQQNCLRAMTRCLNSSFDIICCSRRADKQPPIDVRQTGGAVVRLIAATGRSPVRQEVCFSTRNALASNSTERWRCRQTTYSTTLRLQLFCKVSSANLNCLFVVTRGTIIIVENMQNNCHNSTIHEYKTGLHKYLI